MEFKNNLETLQQSNTKIKEILDKLNIDINIINTLNQDEIFETLKNIKVDILIYKNEINKFINLFKYCSQKK